VLEPEAKKQKYLARGGMTIYFKPVLDKNQAPVFAIGVAFCSPQDTFCKERGRRISEARAAKDVEGGITP